MPQLDPFTYFTQFFWSCLFLFTFYILICNNGDGVLGISRIIKLRNQLRISNSSIQIRLQILRKSFSTGVSYMYSILFEVSQWCNRILVNASDLLGMKMLPCQILSCFGEISGSLGMERNIFYFISTYSTSSNLGWGCRNDIMLIHVIHVQGSIAFC